MSLSGVGGINSRKESSVRRGEGITDEPKESKAEKFSRLFFLFFVLCVSVCRVGGGSGDWGIFNGERVINSAHTNYIGCIVRTLNNPEKINLKCKSQMQLHSRVFIVGYRRVGPLSVLLIV